MTVNWQPEGSCRHKYLNYAIYTFNRTSSWCRSLYLYLCVCVAPSSTTGPDQQTVERETSSRSPSTWSIEEVMQFVRDADPQALAPHAELFRKHVGTVYTHTHLKVLKALQRVHKWFFTFCCLLFAGDRWQGFNAAAQWHDHEVHGSETGSCSQTVPSYWKS